MKLEAYEKEILKNYNYIEKLEEIIPLKKAEIELKLWNKVKEKLEEKLKTKPTVESYDFVEDSLEYLLQKHVDILFFKLENLEEYYEEPIYLGIGRYLAKKGIYFSISDDFLDNKDKKYTSLLNKLKNNENFKKWKSFNDKNLYLDLENEELINLFNLGEDDFYDLLEEEKLNKIVDIIVELFFEEYEKLNTIKL